MKRRDPDMLPTEAVFAVAYHLTRYGTITVEKAAEVAGCSENGVRRMLNKASRTAPIASIRPGVWETTDSAPAVSERLQPILHMLRTETAGKDLYTGYCHPLTRMQAATLLETLEVLLRKCA